MFVALEVELTPCLLRAKINCIVYRYIHTP
jgi:hypothetical protein